MTELIEDMRTIAGLAQMQGVTDPAELHAALSDILETAMKSIRKATES